MQTQTLHCCFSHFFHSFSCHVSISLSPFAISPFLSLSLSLSLDLFSLLPRGNSHPLTLSPLLTSLVTSGQFSASLSILLSRTNPVALSQCGRDSLCTTWQEHLLPRLSHLLTLSSPGAMGTPMGQCGDAWGFLYWKHHVDTQHISAEHISAEQYQGTA